MNFICARSILFLVFFVHTAFGLVERIGKESVKIVADVVQQNVDKLLPACKDAITMVRALGTQGEKIAGIFSETAKHVSKESSQALLESAKLVSVAATKCAKSVKRVSHVAWAAVGTAASYLGYKIGFNLYDRFDKRGKEKTLQKAKLAIISVMIKNAQNKEGLFGIPEGCEKEAAVLLALKDGHQELESIKGSFKSRSTPGKPHDDGN